MAVAADAGNRPVLRVAQLHEMQTLPAPASIVDGALNGAFLTQSTQRLSVSADVDFWYQLGLSANWKEDQPPVLSFQDARGGRTDVPIWLYAPPDYHPNLLRIGTHSGLTRNTPTVRLPDKLRADHFKSINDTYGHAVGDRCLQGIVEVVGRELRETDWMGRYGGEEFVVVLPNASMHSASAIGERVRASIEAHPIHHNGKTVRVTASVGVSGIISGRDNADNLLERADAALYRAKFDGRNRIAMQPLLAIADGA